mgnify:CR=1 FL=1
MEAENRPGRAEQRPTLLLGVAHDCTKAGFDTEAAEQLSRECGVDLHAAIELVERGCPPPLAARILAPLEHERRAC